jgi:ribonucleoside-diphosphate reductase alpha chain
VPNEPCVLKPDQTVVFSFPQKAPAGITREDVGSIDHLALWLTYQRFYCEHKPSVTISVQEKDWPKVGAWVWENFSEISGISFLPYSEHSYKQAPYQECTEQEYEELKAKVPTLNWEDFKEVDDNVEGAQMLACASGVCEL